MILVETHVADKLAAQQTWNATGNGERRGGWGVWQEHIALSHGRGRQMGKVTGKRKRNKRKNINTCRDSRCNRARSACDSRTDCMDADRLLDRIGLLPHQ